MTDLLTTDHADSGEIFHPSVWDTARIDTGERTRLLPTFGRRLPLLLSAVPRQEVDETAEVPTLCTIAVISDPLVVTGELPLLPPGQPRPPQPVPSPNPPPKPAARPWFYRGRRRVRELRPAWAYLTVGAGLGSVATVVLQLAGIAALAVWR